MKYTFLAILSIGLLAAPVWAATVDNSWTTADALAQHNTIRNAVNAGTQPGPVGFNPQPVPVPALVPLTYNGTIATGANTWAAICGFAHDPNLSTNCTNGDINGNGCGETIATGANTWAAICGFAHDPNLSTNCTNGDINGNGCGENIFAGGSTVNPHLWDMNGVVAGSWAAESANYDYTTPNCVAGQCGHYTQIVHQATTEVGCAAYQCTPAELGVFNGADDCDTGPGDQPCTDGVFVVCRYEDIQGSSPTLLFGRPTCKLWPGTGRNPELRDSLRFPSP